MSANAGAVRVAVRAAGLATLAAGLTACALPDIPYINPPPPAAAARLLDASGRAVGRAVLVQQRSRIRLLLDVTGLGPGGKAVHIHEVGRCDPPAFTTAGEHFNPANAAHGRANPRGPHAGDLPDVVVDAEGRGHLEVTLDRVTLRKGPTSLLDADGSAIVVHQRPDDGRSEPDGDSGARIACGVLIPAGPAFPPMWGRPK